MAQAPQRAQRQAAHTPSPIENPPYTPPPAAQETRARGETDPGDTQFKTIGQEQLERSQEIEAMGTEPWKEEHDERKGARQRQVPGVSRTSVDDGEDYPATPTTPPEGHDERQPAPGEPGGPTAGHYPDENTEADAQRRGAERREDRQSRR